MPIETSGGSIDGSAANASVHNGNPSGNSEAGKQPLEPQPFQISLTYDRSINYAFQQNAIPIVKELVLRNLGRPRKGLVIKIICEPAFAALLELHVQSLDTGAEFRAAPLDLKLSPDLLGSINEKISGWLKIEVMETGPEETGHEPVYSILEPIVLLARNEWCGLVALPEILAAFILPNDPAVMQLLGRASEILRESSGRADLNGYQDKNRRRAWDQLAAIYKAVAELGIRYISPPASFENTGQKVRFPSDVVSQRFATCLDLVLLLAACCEQVGLHPLILLHEGHGYIGCWLEPHTLPEPCIDDLQHIRKLSTESLLTVFEATALTLEQPGTLVDAERFGLPHLQTELPFRAALDVQRARLSRIHPIPIPGQRSSNETVIDDHASPGAESSGIGTRQFVDPKPLPENVASKKASRIDQWKAHLLDLSLRNRLLNFKPTKSTIPILSASPERVEDELAAEVELALRPKPKLMSENDPRNPITYTRQQRIDALQEHLRDELEHRRLHTSLDEPEHSARLTDLYRAARLALDENGTNTLFAAVGILEWRETEHSDRVFRAPLLLVPVELKRKSVLEGFTLRRLDEETRLNVTLIEMLRQQFQKEIPGIDPLPLDERGVDVSLVFQRFRDAVRNLSGWELKSELWLGQFSFTKFLLWKDLTDRIGDLTKNKIVRHLVHEAGLPYPNPSRDIFPEDLDKEFHPRELFCPRSADSSQLAAVFAAADGQDFVLEGPPGTGKSQTITNIIAHCLAHGKKVLFVAEKRAALDVVHRRLKEEGFDPFCLELHSNKTGKADVVSQFDKSLKFLAAKGELDWDEHAEDLDKARKGLNAYVQALHFKHPCGLSAHHCLDYLLPRQNEQNVRFANWGEIRQTSRETLTRAREIARLLQDRSRPMAPLANHPLSLIEHEEWSPRWAELAFDQIQEVTAAANDLVAPLSDLGEWLGFQPEKSSLRELTALRDLAESLLIAKPVGPLFLTTPWNQFENDLQQLILLTRERLILREKLHSVFDGTDSDAVGTGVPLRCEKWSEQEWDEHLRRLAELKALTLAAEKALKDLHSLLPVTGDVISRSDLVHRVAVADCLIAPHPVGESFISSEWSKISSQLSVWTRLVQERQELRKKLSEYDEAKLLALGLDVLQDSWAKAGSAWFFPKWIRTSRVRKELRKARRDNIRPSIDGISGVLDSAIRLRAINADIADAKEAATAYLKDLWMQGEPEGETLKGVQAWGEKLHAGMSGWASNDLDSLTKLRTLLGRLFTTGLPSFAASTPAGQMLQRFRTAATDFDGSFDSCASSVAFERAPLDEAPDHLSAVCEAGTLLIEAGSKLRAAGLAMSELAPRISGILGTFWNRGEPDPGALKDVMEWGKALHHRMIHVCGENYSKLGNLRQNLAHLFAEGSERISTDHSIRARLILYQTKLDDLNAKFEKFAGTASLNREPLNRCQDYLGSLLSFLERLRGAWPKVRLWCSWQKVKHEGVRLGLEPLIAFLESDADHNHDLPALFERSFRRALLNSIIETEPVLREFFGAEHAERIEHFREIDEKISDLARRLICSKLAAGIPRDQHIEEIPKQELGLLRKEIGKKARHIPVRQLLRGIPKLLPLLKPCVLMSPLSVAQYLEPSHETFDLVIFDEASQIPVWDAVGAIARGKQLVVVGDPKQLPPTNFFNTTDEPGEESADLNLQPDLESILDELLSNGVRHKRLKWHYRSRHEGLIAFSNRHYYENDLLTFPSPSTAIGGVRFKHIREGRYDKGKSRTNLLEAKLLVEELVSRLRAPADPPKSFGVVTFNQAQQELIEDLLDEERRKFPEIECHFGDEPPIDGEPVFVKNLENVQGDERDIIFFSICYGPDETGRISMNFGPLNRDGGERRLNVAITRAKHEVLVFSSLQSEQIDLTRTRARGARDLKYFLDYAERGPKALSAELSASGEAEADSEFEAMVADRIRKAGFEVHHQVGCSGYRIDLAVVDPTSPGRYILGVECDGATYHRAATARDRDKLRQAVLEGLGWNLYRIWSTDWWHDADGEMEKLLAVIAGLTKEVNENTQT